MSQGLIVARGHCTAKHDLEAPKKHPQLCKPHGVQRTCTITIAVKSSMAPKFTVIVSQKNVATSRIAIDVIPNISSQVTKINHPILQLLTECLNM